MPSKHTLSRIALGLCALLTTSITMGQLQRPVLPAPKAEHPFITGDAQRSELYTVARRAVVSNATVTTHWANTVRSLDVHEHELPEVEAIKEAKLAGKLASIANGKPIAAGSPKTVQPQVGVNFEANWSTQQTPPDNSMAISNGGWIVTTNNDGIEYYQNNGNGSFGAAWADFFSGQGLNANIYDPKVLYDSQADRFFMVVLHGSEAGNSILLLCFSQTNNPNDGWNVYQLTGNALNNNCWFDYPGIGVSNNEVYLTGNLFTSGDNQFNQAILFQIQKAEGYSGNNLNWQYWYNLTADITPFSLVPASWGQSGNYGPGVLLVSSASGGDNRYVVWDLTNDIAGSPSLNTYTVNVNAYSPAADAQMPNNSELLKNGDCRTLGAFFLNSQLHMIHHADVGSGWNGLIYTRISANDLSATQSTFGNAGVTDISYPQFASYATAVTDPSVMVAFLSSSTSVFPEARVVNCDASQQWSNSVQVKAGETYVDFINPGDDRWGDYTGMARKHNAQEPEVWMAACYGANVQGQLDHTWKTWVAQIGDGPSSITESATGSASTVFPSPAMDFFTLTFTVPNADEYSVELLDGRGALVKLLHRSSMAPGDYRLNFNRGQLAAGEYVISIHTPTQRITHEKLVVQ
jgi:hypothetical protein